MSNATWPGPQSIFDMVSAICRHALKTEPSSHQVINSSNNQVHVVLELLIWYHTIPTHSESSCCNSILQRVDCFYCQLSYPDHDAASLLHHSTLMAFDFMHLLYIWLEIEGDQSAHRQCEGPDARSTRCCRCATKHPPVHPLVLCKTKSRTVRLLVNSEGLHLVVILVPCPPFSQ